MTLSIWRYAHLLLAIVSSVFLLILSVTGVILAFDAIHEKTPRYSVDNFENITLAQSLPALRDAYFEILHVTVDHNDFVLIEAMDEDGNTIQAYIDPLTGEKLGDVVPKSQFIQWTTALHRSLFLKETGRTIVGVVSFLLMLITISGLILIIKRQQGIKHFFDKINKDFFSQYFHVVTGRWLLIPVLMIALTGTAIFLIRLDFFKSENTEIDHQPISEDDVSIALQDIVFFKNTKLADVNKIEFPFIPDDPEEPFIITLNDRSVSINQVNGDLMQETKFPYSAVLEKLNIDLHTGRTNIIWAIILGLASLNIVFFIYTGFVITFKRTRTKIRNKYKAAQAEIVILVGSENGSTLFFANQIHKQLLADGKRSFLAEINQYQSFPAAQQLLIFTSTYGLGDPPSNASKFESLLHKFTQQQAISYSIIGFGSRAYADFCAYAQHVEQLLSTQPWAKKLLDTHYVNDRSTNDFVEWASDWSAKSLHAVATAPAVYNSKVPDLRKFKVVSKTLVSDDNSTFKIILKPVKSVKFDSGDLLAIYPAKDNRERFYSIGRQGKNVQLIVKLFPTGLGSSYLYTLEPNQVIDARLMANPNFHLPKLTSKVALISNGTGIAPFLGMVTNNKNLTEIHLYAGFRKNNELIDSYKKFAKEYQELKQLTRFELAFSREHNKAYVMDLILRDYFFFANLLQEGGVIMICGALKMQKDVERTLNEITTNHHGKSLQHYIDNNQILTDCY
ncbi:sulfite reductase (NADPH) flavoprotein alpha-component [Sphingobacterium alimentarium]|uniref:NADPH--hemoprotein reductase n=1 Tax=Sphingobacterium alimentarium TaxID=797292 RepID=A0A4V2VTK0_9SPHI|nr:PepSY domain-containing protein [Sphingobacterium alimentarium]TCV07275.1 sulfite reductase (NADPH) flavoprotein alpha-component [Sphingobacterium alimentarium]